MLDAPNGLFCTESVVGMVEALVWAGVARSCSHCYTSMSSSPHQQLRVQAQSLERHLISSHSCSTAVLRSGCPSMSQLVGESILRYGLQCHPNPNPNGMGSDATVVVIALCCGQLLRNDEHSSPRESPPRIPQAVDESDASSSACTRCFCSRSTHRCQDGD